MGRASSWLEGAQDEGGLLIPADPAKHGCDLILRPDHVEVHAGEEAGAALAWDELDSRFRVLDAARDRWRFDAWAADDSGLTRRFVAGTGIGIEVEGRCRTATVEVVAARQTRRNRFNRSMARGVSVPLAPWSRQSPALSRDLLLVDVLCAVLAERPEARARLADPARVAQLARDLLGEPREVVEVPALARSATVEVLEALREHGVGHRYGGRPLPGEVLPTAAELVQRLQRAGVEAAPDRIEAVVEEHHLGVEPWPFAAVTVG